MQSKKEAIEILQANLENAINCNDTYMCSVIHRKGCITINDVYGGYPLKYDTTIRKTSTFEQIANEVVTDACPPSHIKEIAANTNDIKHLLKDMRTLLTDHRVKEVFQQSQCNHIKGTTRDKVNGNTYLGTEAEERPNYKYDKLFKFCPECGSKLR